MSATFSRSLPGFFRKTLLGSVLRIDVNGNSGNKAYGIPADNPFINQPDIPDEVYAYGVRNMWRCDVDEGDPTNGGMVHLHM